MSRGPSIRQQVTGLCRELGVFSQCRLCITESGAGSFRFARGLGESCSTDLGRVSSTNAAKSFRTG